MSSPEKKRSKIDPKDSIQKNDSENVCMKRLRSEVKADLLAQNEVKALRRKNFVAACEKVSCEAYFDRHSRLQLVYLPVCGKAECSHSTKYDPSIREMPLYAVETFNIEVNTRMWYDALEVCQISTTYNQYLSADVLKDIVEIMMNVHEDIFESYSIEELIDKCQQVLALNFSTHPPCHDQKLRECYKKFLTSEMQLRNKTFTNRSEFGCSQGIVKYCMNRLADEMKEKSKDEPIVNKYENIPEEMKEGVKGLHWEKEKFEIFELLKRPERIERLMAVLQSVIELLQYDLVIWQTRYTKNIIQRIMIPKIKPLIATYLWTDIAYKTGAVTNTCLQIIKLFIDFIHLQYPEEHVQVMTSWMNTMVQTFYLCETDSNSDYPNTGKYCKVFASKFHENMKGLPIESTIRILERIQPSFMRDLIGMHVTKQFLSTREFLSTNETDIVKLAVAFLKKRQWEHFKQSDEEIQLLTSPSGSEDDLQSLIMRLQLEKPFSNSNNNNDLYPKLRPSEYIYSLEQVHVVYAIYITLAAHFDAYSVQSVQDTLEQLYEKKQDVTGKELLNLPIDGVYSVSDDFIKKYRSMYQTLSEFILIWHEMRDSEEFADVLKVFENLPFLP